MFCQTHTAIHILYMYTCTCVSFWKFVITVKLQCHWNKIGPDIWGTTKQSCQWKYKMQIDWNDSNLYLHFSLWQKNTNAVCHYVSHTIYSSGMIFSKRRTCTSLVRFNTFFVVDWLLEYYVWNPVGALKLSWKKLYTVLKTHEYFFFFFFKS